MQEQSQLREDNWQSSLCSKPEYMFMNDKQSKLVKSSTAQCNDLPKQMQARRSFATSVDNRPSTNIAGTYIFCNGGRSQFNRCNGSPFIKTQRTCHWSHTSPTRYLNKSSTINNNNNSLFTAFPASNFTGQAIGVKHLKKSRDSSRLTPWKRCPKCSGLLHAREPGNFGGGPVGCQNITAKNQSLREERSSTETQHSNLLFKYQVGTSTPMSEQEPRHMEAPQYRLNCQEADI